jgi:hypothetical protein
MTSFLVNDASDLGLVANLVAKAMPSATRPVKTAQEARDLAERATGGLAVSARLFPLNGSTGGWAVALHIPGEGHGWHCLLDRDSHSIYTRPRIPNPSRPKPRR